jgi:uncharacterized protein YecA (UPF0149 family)
MDIEALYDAVDARLDATDLAGAAQLLESISFDDVDDDDDLFALVELWGYLGDAYADRNRFDDAISALRRCLDVPIDVGAGLRARIAGYDYRAGREEEARQVWAELAGENPTDPWLRFTAGLACADADEPEEALPWLSGALEQVVAHGDREGLLADLLELREEVLADVGEPIDELQERGEALLERQLRQFSGGSPQAVRHEVSKTAVAWFPESEWPQAVEQWPDVTQAAGTDDYRGYVQHLQRELVELQAGGVSRLSLAPLFIDAYVIWTQTRDLDPASADSRATYAEEVARVGNEVPWPPGRNDPCWCGSGAKYKKCCAAR